MGGKVLEYEAKTILNRGREEGRLVGRAEGREEERPYIIVTFYRPNIFKVSSTSWGKKGVWWAERKAGKKVVWRAERKAGKKVDWKARKLDDWKARS